jgi:hypothetical protein
MRVRYSVTVMAGEALVVSIHNECGGYGRMGRWGKNREWKRVSLSAEMGI